MRKSDKLILIGAIVAIAIILVSFCDVIKQSDPCDKPVSQQCIQDERK